ncbi:hypothetical protein [Desulfitobacterium dehalogenans]|nr:hypothetical protein [Desulfitobacterium dehalogenans]
MSTIGFAQISLMADFQCDKFERSSEEMRTKNPVLHDTSPSGIPCAPSAE